MFTPARIYYETATKIRNNFLRPAGAARGWCELLNVNPASITRHSGRNRTRKEDFCCFGSKVSGEWDTKSRQDKYAFLFQGDLQRCIFVQSLREHFDFGKRWDDTEFIKFMKRTAPHPGWPSYKDKAHIEKKCTALDNLFKSIEKDGFRTAREIYSRRILPRKSFLNVCAQEVTVDISRNDEKLLFDGKHRLAIALIQELHVIPVQVLAIHPLNIECAYF